MAANEIVQDVITRQVRQGRVIRGAWLCPDPVEPTWRSHKDAALIFDERGVILALIDIVTWSESFPSLPLPEIKRPGAIWMPGFVDTHVHYPQTAIIGSASGPLLDWLYLCFPRRSEA